MYWFTLFQIYSLQKSPKLKNHPRLRADGGDGGNIHLASGGFFFGQRGDARYLQRGEAGGRAGEELLRRRGEGGDMRQGPQHI